MTEAVVTSHMLCEDKPLVNVAGCGSRQESADALLAFAVYALDECAEEIDCPMVYLHELHVTPRLQRTRLGSRLMRSVKSAACANVRMNGILLTRWKRGGNGCRYF